MSGIGTVSSQASPLQDSTASHASMMPSPLVSAGLRGVSGTPSPSQWQYAGVPLLTGWG
jgi:hypothetical protein